MPWGIRTKSRQSEARAKGLIWSCQWILKAYKEKYRHLNLSPKEDRSIYNFCYNIKRSRIAIISGIGKTSSYRLDDDRIAVLDTIGFKGRLGGSYTVASNNDNFFARVDKLKTYKEKHGHLKFHKKEDKSIYNFCRHMREARRAKQLGKIHR